jgi:hypothetical protein
MTLRDRADAGGKYAENDKRYWSNISGGSGAVHSACIASSIPRLVIVGGQGAGLRPLTPGAGQGPGKMAHGDDSAASKKDWDKDRTDRFEAAMRDLGLLLGFGSQRPDQEYKDGGPDNLWAVGELNFLVIECKSGVDNDGRLISKTHCNQLLGAHSWFKTNYDHSCRSTPILVHPSSRFQSEASPSSDMRIIDDRKLTKLREAVRGFSASVAGLGGFQDETEIGKKLDQFGFTVGYGHYDHRCRHDWRICHAIEIARRSRSQHTEAARTTTGATAAAKATATTARKVTDRAPAVRVYASQARLPGCPSYDLT